MFQDAKCCLFPPFFVREIARECGAIFSLKYRSVEHNITSFRREAMTVGTPKEEAKSLAMLLKSVYEKALRGIKNHRNVKHIKEDINISTYRTKEKRSKKKKPIVSRKRRHKSQTNLKNRQLFQNISSRKNQSSPHNQSPIPNHTSSPNHQSSQKQNKSSQFHLSVRFYLWILSLMD